MMSRTEKIYWFLNKAIAAISAVLLLFLLYYSLFYSHMFPKDYLEWEHVVSDPIWMHFVFGILAVFLAFVIRRGIKAEKAQKISGIVLIAVFALVGIVYVFDGTTFSPTGDQLFLLENASLFLKGNYGGLVGGGYLAQYPYQLGLTLYMEIVTVLAGEYAQTALIVLNLLAMIVMSIIGARLTENLFGKQVSLYYALLLIFLFPLYFYISFIYGECMSMMFSVLFVWQMTVYLKNQRVRNLIFMCFAAFVSVVFRANSMIVVIAAVIVFLLRFIKERKPMLLLAALLCLVFVFAGRGLIQAGYELRSGQDVPDGIPPTGWIAMGMQEGVRGNGWYSEYGVEIYENNGYNTELANEEAMSYIRRRLAEFADNPGIAWQFYREKILSQWDEPSYQALLVLNAGVDHSDISQMKHEIMFGRYYDGILQFMNLFQSLLYAAALVSALYLILKRGEASAYLFHLIFIGGFLFQMLWEAKSRYVLFYIVMMLPLCAMGISVICESLEQGWKKFVQIIKK